MLFADEVFDLVAAFETVYFWLEPGKSFREAYRVMKKAARSRSSTNLTAKQSR